MKTPADWRILGEGQRHRRAREQLKLGKLQATPPYGEASPDCEVLSDTRRSRLRSGSAHWHLALVVQIRERPLTSGMRGWAPAEPTEIWSSRLTSGSAHWDLEVLKTGHTFFCGFWGMSSAATDPHVHWEEPPNFVAGIVSTFAGEIKLAILLCGVNPLCCQ